ncbi:10365_t:CDS:2 [Entrophospora sp. SA101]|nr:878_t:CDS:2 [Entrophospora sp. SA101]CAJ0904838.1 10365_t:CDS:2 [Entrophospora sp. SA101]
MSVDNVVKVANISSKVSELVLKKIFEHLGEVTSITLYNSPHGDNVQECTIEFKEVSSAMTALHLTGMELGDRALLVSSTLAPPSITIPPKPMLPTTLTFPTFTTQSLTTIRSANPSISPTVAQFDPAKAEEISRTVYIGNINSSISDPELIQFFSACGPVAYVKMAGDPAQPTRFAFLEFATFEGAQAAMLMNGVMLGDRPLKVNHSKNAINKTPKKTDAPDVQATMRRVREAQLRIANRLNTDKLLATANASLDVVASTNVPRSRSRSVKPDNSSLSYFPKSGRMKVTLKRF